MIKIDKSKYDKRVLEKILENKLLKILGEYGNSLGRRHLTYSDSWCVDIDSADDVYEGWVGYNGKTKNLTFHINPDWMKKYKEIAEKLEKVAPEWKIVVKVR